jgi:putative inorganic carbon (HCO3(-)) transporter
MSRENLGRAALYLGLASAAAILVSITASQILLGLALVALLASREKLRLPRIWLPLSLFLAGTLLSLVFSPHPMHGLPQVKKMFVFSILLVLYSTMRDVITARRLFLAWGVIGTAVACLGVGQFAEKVRESQLQHRPFYEFYNDARITGAMSHWMTFAGQEMLVLLMLLAFLLFAPRVRPRAWWMWAACVLLLGAALLLNETRTVWLGVAVAGVWLLWGWKRWMALIVPASILLLMWLVPGPVHERLRSTFAPKADVDSNGFRTIARATGYKMIAAHPLLGIGLDETKYQFLDYLPPEYREHRPPGYYKHLHNFYLQFAAERGIPTMLMMIWMLLLIVYDFFVALQKLPPGPSDERFLLQGGIAAVIGIMVSGLFEVNLGDTEVLTAFLAIVACGYVAVASGAARSPLGKRT